MEGRREVMWRGKGGLSISHFYVGEQEPAQGWHAKILTCGLWIFMRGHPRREIVEDTQVSLECNPILRVPASFPRTRGFGWGRRSAE